MKKLGLKWVAGMLCIFMLSMGMSVSVPRSVSAEEEKPIYHAALGIQTATQIWIQRWGYYHASFNEFYDTTNFDKLYDSQKQFYNGNFEDVEIKGNGTYTVSLKNAEFMGETTVSQLHVATDIPVAESEKMTFSDVKLEINGNEILKFDTAVMENEENYMQGGAVILLLNHWREELIATLKTMGRGEDSSNGWELLQGSGMENVSVTFTVSGLPYDNEEQMESKEEGAENGEVLSATDKKTSAGDVGKKDGKKEDTAHTVAVVVFALVVVCTLIGVILHYKKRFSR